MLFKYCILSPNDIFVDQFDDNTAQLRKNLMIMSLPYSQNMGSFGKISNYVRLMLYYFKLRGTELIIIEEKVAPETLDAWIQLIHENIN